MTNALTHIKYLAEDIGPRAPTSGGEKTAAKYLENYLESLGSDVQVSVQSFRGTSTWSWPNIFSWLFPQIAILIFLISPTLAAIVAGIGVFAFLFETDNRPNISRLFYTRMSQNVIGKIKTKQLPVKKVVLIAHYDSSKADFTHHPKRVASFRKLALMNLVILFLIFGLYSVGALFEFIEVPLIPSIIWPISLILVIPSLYSSLLLILREWRNELVPGANDNASGVAIALELVKSFIKEPLQETEIISVFTGCEEAFCTGMIEFLKKFGKDLREAYFINLDNIGAGTPIFAPIEGMIFSRKADPEMLQIAREIQINHPELNVEERSFRAGYTDGTVAIIRGYKVLSFLALNENDVPPNWHWETDTIENIDKDTLSNVEEFVKKLIREIDQKTNFSS
ncbi:MAG: M28 family metallopeptidase [Promethearchaeota archaeon]